MNNYRNTDKDIHTRIYRFVINCFRDIIKPIRATPVTIPIISQITSSLTSMGANDQEADAAGSKRDFIAKYMIVRKETKETKYWLSVIRDLELVKPKAVNCHIEECQEILNIVSTIIKHLSN
jgi:four helix bundle protein